MRRSAPLLWFLGAIALAALPLTNPTEVEIWGMRALVGWFVVSGFRETVEGFEVTNGERTLVWLTLAGVFLKMARMDLVEHDRLDHFYYGIGEVAGCLYMALRAVPRGVRAYLDEARRKAR